MAPPGTRMSATTAVLRRALGHITPKSARAALLMVVLLDVLLETRTFADAQTGLDTALDHLPLVCDLTAMATVILGLRHARFVGFKDRSRPLHLKLAFVLSAVAWGLFLQSPHYRQTDSFSGGGGHYYVQTNGRPSVDVGAAAYWSRLHAHDRFEIAANLLVIAVMLGIVEARIATRTRR